MENRYKEFMTLEGYTDDLLLVSDNNESGKPFVKGTRLIHFNDGLDCYGNVIDVSITSSNGVGEHNKFDTILGKKIKITIHYLEEENSNE